MLSGLRGGKRFDLLILRLQLAILRSDPGSEPLRDRVRRIAGLLEEKAAIPMVQQQITLIQEIQAEEWWQDVTTTMLEQVRKALRQLVLFVDRERRRLVYTDFEDRMGKEVQVDLPGF